MSLAFLDLKAACLEFKYAGKQRNRAIAGKEPMKTAVVGLVHRFVKTFTDSGGGVRLGAWPENPNFQLWSLAQRKSNAL
jgi:hypothetical protein